MKSINVSRQLGWLLSGFALMTVVAVLGFAWLLRDASERSAATTIRALQAQDESSDLTKGAVLVQEQAQVCFRENRWQTTGRWVGFSGRASSGTPDDDIDSDWATDSWD